MTARYTVRILTIDLCIDCAPGKWSNVVAAHNRSTCIECEQDSYSGEEGRNTSCESCDSDATTMEIGQTVCVKCTAGQHMETVVNGQSKHCRICPSGFVSVYGEAKCTQCRAGRWGNEARTQCLLCLTGLFSSELGASLPSACQNCTVGRYSSVLGTQSNEQCNKCAPGRASNFSGATSSASCRDCSIGLFAQMEGSTQCLHCPTGYTNRGKNSLLRCCIVLNCCVCFSFFFVSKR